MGKVHEVAHKDLKDRQTHIDVILGKLGLLLIGMIRRTGGQASKQARGCR